jgi:hypothetical protein
METEQHTAEKPTGDWSYKGGTQKKETLESNENENSTCQYLWDAA